MKLHPEDPRLTAYLLGELPADEVDAVERAIAADPALQAALRELENVRNVLADTLAPTSCALLLNQRETILQASRQVAPLTDRGRSWKPWRIPLAAAAAMVLAIIIFASGSNLRKHDSASNPPVSESPRQPDAPKPELNLLPTPESADTANAPAAPPAPPANFAPPSLHGGSSVAALDFPTLALPIQTGNFSLGRIREIIRSERRLPPHDSVRLEEILNSFALRPNGLTGVARIPATAWHPDNRSDGTTTHAATIATEILACPWKPSASLVLISIRGNPHSDCQVKAVFRANSENVRCYRLLGFSPIEGESHSSLPDKLPAKAITTLAIEVEPSTSKGEFGSIEWSVNDQPAAPIPLTRSASVEPSDDARFAALVCTYAQWLAGEASGMIDVELLAALARETTSETMPEDRADFLKLIDQSLNL